MASTAEVRLKPLLTSLSGSRKRSRLVLWLASSELSSRKVWKPKLENGSLTTESLPLLAYKT
jgi:hypothetical protein